MIIPKSTETNRPVIPASDLVRITASLDALGRWVETAQYKGYEPFDGLSSPLRRLAGNNVLALRILQQAVRQSPLNLRPWVGIRPQESTKGRGAMAAGYLFRFEATGHPDFRTKAEACLRWLDTQKSPKFEKHSWANAFDFASRGGLYSKDDSIIVWTAQIAQTYLEAFEQWHDERHLAVAVSACDWIFDLPREKTPTGDCISYFAHEQESIHNASMLGAAALARAYKSTGRADYLEAARSAMEYSCTRQREDGSWWYAEEPKFHWIDNFHTGYNLDSLATYLRCSGDAEYQPNLRRGLEYFKKTFFEADGCPKYYHTRKYPVDVQCASQAIDTLAYLSTEDPDCLPLGVKVADWAIKNLGDRAGFFYYRIYPFGVKARTPMLHWGQATMYRALAHLVLQSGTRP